MFRHRVVLKTAVICKESPTFAVLRVIRLLKRERSVTASRGVILKDSRELEGLPVMEVEVVHSHLASGLSCKPHLLGRRYQQLNSKSLRAAV